MGEMGACPARRDQGREGLLGTLTNTLLVSLECLAQELRMRYEIWKNRAEKGSEPRERRPKKQKGPLGRTERRRCGGPSKQGPGGR